jgi:MFS family permease
MRATLLPGETSADAAIVITSRAVRAFVDGLVSVVLPIYLVLIGFNGWQIGAIVTGTLLGSAALVLATGLGGHRVPRSLILRGAPLLMIATGVGFGLITWFPALLVAAIVGTLNPSGGDVSVFLPTEQALLAQQVSDRQRTAVFARFSVVALLLAALGSLAAGLPDLIARHTRLGQETAYRLVFAVYAAAGVVVYALYRRLTPTPQSAGERPAALGPSRRLVLRLAATFSLDAFGGGFVVQSLLALWLYRRFHLSLAMTGQVFFWSGLLSGLSSLFAARIARRIGLVRTMAYTHLPANILLMLTPFMPNATTAVACLLARSLLSTMDVPARTSYVMAVVTPAERAAAASVTNVPRGLTASLAPLAGGWLLDRSRFGWPLVVGGGIKAVYDLLVLALFRQVRPPEERAA